MRCTSFMIGACLTAGLAQLTLAVPPTMNFQGFLEDGAGQPVTGIVGVTTRIYDANSTGVEVWTEPTQPAVDVQDGVFKIMLGDGAPLTEAVFASETALEIEIDGEILSPRILMRSVPYAFQSDKAGNADRLNGITSSEFVQVSDLKRPGFLVMNDISFDYHQSTPFYLVIREETFLTSAPAVVAVDSHGQVYLEPGAYMQVLLDGTVVADFRNVNQSVFEASGSNAMEVSAGSHTIQIIAGASQPWPMCRLRAGQFRIMWWE